MLLLFRSRALRVVEGFEIEGYVDGIYSAVLRLIARLSDSLYRWQNLFPKLGNRLIGQGRLKGGTEVSGFEESTDEVPNDRTTGCLARRT